MPKIHSPSATGTPDQIEKGRSPPVQARVTVSHLTIAPASAKDKDDPNLTFVSEDTSTPNSRVIAAIFASEFTGIMVAMGVIVG